MHHIIQSRDFKWFDKPLLDESISEFLQSEMYSIIFNLTKSNNELEWQLKWTDNIISLM